jgi:hypothetical protein
MLNLKTRLLQIIVPKAKLGRIKIGEEDRICIEFANYLRQLTLENLPWGISEFREIHTHGRPINEVVIVRRPFRYIWFHIPNQIGSYKPIHGLKQGWMGRHPGVPDFCFVGEEDSFFIEFKTSKGKLSEEQKIFQEWCDVDKVPYYVCRSFEEGKEIVDRKRI